MNFKEFLERKRGFGSDGYYFDGNPKGSEIEIEALGEWALEECKEELYSWKDVGERFEEIKKFYFEEKYNDTSETYFDYAFKIGINSNLFSIAVACLGEKTVIEKLKELK